MRKIDDHDVVFQENKYYTSFHFLVIKNMLFQNCQNSDKIALNYDFLSPIKPKSAAPLNYDIGSI
jgi:hypothetical protein